MRWVRSGGVDSAHEPAPGSSEHGEDSRFKQKGVPLVSHEDAADIGQREIAQPHREQERALGHAGGDQRRRRHASPANRADECVAVVPEKDRRQVSERRFAVAAKILLRGFEEVTGGQDAIVPNQAIALHAP